MHPLQIKERESAQGSRSRVGRFIEFAKYNVMASKVMMLALDGRTSPSSLASE